MDLGHLRLGGLLDVGNGHDGLATKSTQTCTSVPSSSPMHDALERAGLEDAEHLDRQLLVAAQRERGRVHHLQVLDDRLVEADLGVARRARVLLRVGGVDAVDLGRLQHDLRADLGAAQRGRGVGGEERVAGAGGEDDDLAFLEVLQRLGPHVGLDDLLDADRRHHARRHALLAHRVGQRERVHHGGEHAHVVGGGAVHADRAAGHAAEDVAAADHDRDLAPELRHLLDLAHHAHDRGAVDAVGIVAHQGLAGEFQQDALVRGHGGGLLGLVVLCARKSNLRAADAPPGDPPLRRPWPRRPAPPLRRRSRRPSSRCLRRRRRA